MSQRFTRFSAFTFIHLQLAQFWKKIVQKCSPAKNKASHIHGALLCIFRSLCFHSLELAERPQVDCHSGNKGQRYRRRHGQQQTVDTVFHPEQVGKQLGKQHGQRYRQHHLPDQGQQGGFNRLAQGLEEDSGRTAPRRS